MKRKYIYGFTIIFIFILIGLIYNAKLEKKPLSYTKAIDEVFDRDINGISIVVCSTPNLFFNRNVDVLFSDSWSKEKNFSQDSKDGDVLLKTKQLFLSIKDLKTLREGLPKALEPEKGLYFIIQTSQDYFGEKTTGLHHLTLFVNSKNYNIYIPKDYDEANPILIDPAVYVEYESNDITKKLINEIVKQ